LGGLIAEGGFAMTCSHCHSHDLVEIRMQLHAQTVTMHSCQTCERRWWDRDGQSVGLRSVLDLVAARLPFAIRRSADAPVSAGNDKILSLQCTGGRRSAIHRSARKSLR